MLRALLLLSAIAAASAIRAQTREAIINMGYGTDENSYTETPEACKLYGDTALHMYDMRNESQAVWLSTTPTTAVILRDAMLAAAENLGVLARITSCDMSVFTPEI